MEAYAQKVADSGFHDPGNYNLLIHMYDQGIPLSELFGKYHWLQTSWYSFYGVFGQMNIFLPSWIYRSVIIFLLILAGSMLVRVIRQNKKNFKAYGIVISLIVTALINLIASIHNSWTWDFQPQGRYLFPILPALGYAIYHYRDCLRFFDRIAIILFYMLSLYSSILLFN